MSLIEIIAVSTPAELDRFIELPVRLYKADASGKDIAAKRMRVMEVESCPSLRDSELFIRAGSSWWVSQ
jgi:hypothetical protein